MYASVGRPKLLLTSVVVTPSDTLTPTPSCSEIDECERNAIPRPHRSQLNDTNMTEPKPRGTALFQTNCPPTFSQTKVKGFVTSKSSKVTIDMQPKCPSAPSGLDETPSSSSWQGGLKKNLWKKIVTEYCSLSTLLRTMIVCKDWYKEACSSKWIQECLLTGNVVGDEPRRLWRFSTKADEIELYWKKYFRVATSYEAYDFLRSDARPAEKTAEIDRDVPRTFPLHPQFQTDESRESIRGVLRALSAANPKVGYCQGMNFVAAVFLLHVNFDEAQATWLVLAMMKHYSYDQLYSPGVPLLPLRTFQFCGLIKKYLLPVFAHCKTNGFEVDIFSHQWMMTLFAYMIEPAFLGYIWNVVFFIGWKAVFQAGIGIMNQLRDDILKADGLEGISTIVHSQRTRLAALFDTRVFTKQHALANVFRVNSSVKTKDLAVLSKEYILQKWDAFLITESLPPGFSLISSTKKNQQKHQDLLIDADAFICRDDPPWRRGDVVHHFPKITVAYEVCRRFRTKILEWDEVVKKDVEVFQRRIAAALRDLQEFERTHQGLQKDVVALEDSKGEFRHFKQTLIQSLHATSVESSPHRGTVAGLTDKIIETERIYVQICDRLAAKSDQWTPLRDELEELRMKKAIVIDQLPAFLNATQRQRHIILEESWNDATGGWKNFVPDR